MRTTGIFIALSALLMLAGCFFDASGIEGSGGAEPSQDAAPGPDTTEEPDAPSGGIEDVIHVPAAAETGGETDLVLKDGDVIDTGELTLNSEVVPAGAVFDTSPQDDAAGPELAILHVRDLEVEQAATVHIIGSRPLVILAAGTVVIAGTLDAAATRTTPGPGGVASGLGPGLGGDGEHKGDYRDSGGGGAGHATAGGAGGEAACSESDCAAVAGAFGASYGEAAVQVLQGGSGGGAASPSCGRAGGAGGGAIQIYALESITITPEGGINAGGGGGGRGVFCNFELTSGAGGGAGGIIFLQSRVIDHQGILAANGGGGGGGAGSSGFTVYEGRSGVDGPLSTEAAPGGNGGRNYGFAGGKGGAADVAPEDGLSSPANNNGGNGGGGGGAVGYIVLATSGELTGEGQSSPAATPRQY